MEMNACILSILGRSKGWPLCYPYRCDTVSNKTVRVRQSTELEDVYDIFQAPGVGSDATEDHAGTTSWPLEYVELSWFLCIWPWYEAALKYDHIIGPVQS